MEEKMNFEEFAPYFGMWADKFKPFIESKEMFDIYQRIKADAAKQIILPKSDVTFRSFQESNPNNIRTVWILMDPYPRRYKDKTPQATGIPMDCSNSPDGTLQPSLDIFYDGIEEYLGKKVERSPDLTYLLKQGVLLLNSDLTVKMGKTSSHEGYWEPFMKYFLEEIMFGTNGIIYVLSGKSSTRLEKYINPLGNYIFKIDHPSSAQYSHTAWKHGDIFKKTDKILKDNQNYKIYWDKKDYDLTIDEPPF